MGLLYSKYSDPLSYLNLGHETVGIYRTVTQVYIDKNNSELWDLYLHFKPKKSFDVWKREVTGNVNVYADKRGPDPESIGTKNAEETKNIINKSSEILKGFKPISKRKKR